MKRALYLRNYQNKLRIRRRCPAAWVGGCVQSPSRDYLLERPLLRAISAPRRVVLLIDDRQGRIESSPGSLKRLRYVPELGTLRAIHNQS
jgi:hypothetical protein